MLRQLRSGRNMKTIMWIVAVSFFVGFIILSDGLNVGRGGGSTQSSDVGSVNGRKITAEVYRQVRNQFIDSERGRSPSGELRSSDYERLEEAAWEFIVTQILLEQEADRLGLVTLDEDVIRTMTLNPPPFVRQQFSDANGEFDVQAFQQALNDPSLDWRPAEEEVRRQVRMQKLQMMVYARASVSEAEVREEFMRRELPCTARYVGKRWSEIDLGDYEPTDAEVRQFYDENSSAYARAEHVILEALRISKSASDDDRTELVEEAEAMLGELRSGSVSSFALLAEIYSESPSASRGGELGWTSRSSLPSEVADAAWELEPGQRTTPVVTARGVHIVQVDSSRTEEDDTRSLFLREVFLTLEPSRDTLDSLNQLAFDVAKAAADDFEGAAEDAGLSIETLQPLEANGFLPGFGFAVRMQKWAFDAQIGAVSGPFVGDDASLVVRVAEHRAPEPRPFDEVEARVRAGLLEERKKQEARRIMQSVVDAARAGSSLAEAAKTQSLAVEEPEPFSYYDGAPGGPGGNNEFTAAAYALLPEQVSPVIETPTGAYVLELVARDAFDEAEYRTLRATHYQSLIARRATQIYDAWLEELRNEADVVDQRSPA